MLKGPEIPRFEGAKQKRRTVRLLRRETVRREIFPKADDPWGRAAFRNRLGQSRLAVFLGAWVVSSIRSRTISSVSAFTGSMP